MSSGWRSGERLFGYFADYRGFVAALAGGGQVEARMRMMSACGTMARRHSVGAAGGVLDPPPHREGGHFADRLAHRG